MKKIYLQVLFLFATLIAFCQNPVMVKDIYPGITTSGIQQIVKTTNYTFFNAEDDDADPDRGLYRTDGTAGGTIKLNLQYPTYISTKAEKLTALGNKIIFAGDNFPNYGEIWASDGTQAGTIALERFQPTLPNVKPVMDMVALGNEVLYGVVNNANRSLLKKTDGTPGGTSVVYDFSSFNRAVDLALFRTINNVTYFNVYDLNGTGVDQLWRSDGTPAGTYMLKDFGLDQYAASWYMPAGNLFYFMIVKPGTGNVLWKSDGTAAGTSEVKTIGTTGNNNYPQHMAIGSTLYFAGLDGNGMELWKTDGTAAGTGLVSDINPGSTGSFPNTFTLLNNTLYFNATTAAAGSELWKFDGINASLVKDINPGTAGSNAGAFVVSNNTILFRAQTPAYGSELWITDGTSQNTLQVSDINPGVNGSGINLLTPGNPVYFIAGNGVNGVELYKYDNTAGIDVHKIFVNDNTISGDVFTTASGNNSNPGTRAAPVATINYAISIAQPGDTIVVDAGMYPENITLNKSLTLRGTKAGICPGASLSRGNETIITPPATNFLTVAGNLITITAPDVKLDGLTLDGDNPTLTSGYNMNGADVDGFSGITNNTATAANMQVVNCIIKNFNRNGIGMSNNVSGINISCNHIDNLARIIGTQGILADARAVNMFGNNYGTITNNHFTRVSTGIIISSAISAAASTPVLSNNTISSYTIGINFQAFSGTATPYEITGNTITTADYATWNVTGQTNPSLNSNEGIRQLNMSVNSALNFSNNNISGCNSGFNVSNVTSVTGALNFTNNNITGNATGMNLYQVTAPGDMKVTGGSISGSNSIGIFYNAAAANNSKLNLDGVSLTNNNVGIDASYVSGSALPLQFNNTTISGGTTGLRLYGNVSVPGGVLSGINFSGQSTSYIQLTNYAFQGQVINATALTFEGLNGAAMTLAQRFATEDKIVHQVDYNGGGFIRIKSGEVFVTPQSFIGTFPVSWGTPTTAAAISRAVSTAVTGDIINIAAGIYTGQVSIDKALTLKGEGAGQSIIARGTTGVLTKLPGLYEAGIVQSTAVTGDIIITDLTVDGSNGTSTLEAPHHAILLQGGGAIRNCEIKNMQIQGPQSMEGNGIYVGYNGSDPKVMDISNNNIHDFTWVGMNVQGNNLTSSITNNNINATGTIYGMAMAIGGWGSTLSGLTLTNNSISNYNGFGLSVGSNNTLINNNSFTTESNVSTIVNNGPLINASCNWFGTVEAELIQAKISGLITYGPWLTNGTDNNVAVGFQPVPGACNGRQNKFYVNDGSQIGDIFTTAVGNDANNGFSSAPFASIPYAYSVAQAGDTIFVDAGTYDLAGFVYSFPKAMTILGANFQVSPNDASNKLIANAGRNSESIITNGILSIAATNLTFKGFTLNLGDHRAIDMQAGSIPGNLVNFVFEKNILKINTVGNFNQFLLTGTTVTVPALPLTSGFTFNDNRFEKTGSVGGTTFNFNYVKDITVSNNAFVVTGTTFKTQVIANIGNTGIVDNYNFQNNAADGAGIVANCSRLSSAIISQNILNNCDRGINVQGSMLQSSSLEFNNNTLIQTTGGTPFLGYNRAGSSNPAHTTIFKVQNNLISGTRVEGLANQFYGAMNFTINNSEKNPLFTISGNQVTFTGDFSSVGASEVRPITVRGNISNLTMRSNEIRFINSGTLGAAVGLPSNPAFTINTDFGAGAYMPSNAVINILNNKVQGFKQSIVFYDGVNGINAFTGYGNIPAGATVNINNNSFTGDSISINNGNVGEMINANCNWYGFTASQNVSPKVTETTVNHAPWLTNGTDTDVATGFQPMADVCNGTPVDADIITVTNVTCNGAANGSIEVLIEEGVAPYTYAWSKDDVAGFSTTEDLSNLAPGEYKLIVTDVNGSIDSVMATITEPDVLSASATGTNNICYGGTIGTSDLTVSGGTLPYAYVWSNGATTESISDLAAGNYSVTITDANGCTTTASYEVTQPTQLTASVTGSSSSCANTATVNATGGTGSYSYLWSNGATTPSITSVPSGTYSVTVTDANGCTAVASVTLTANEAFNPSAQATDVTCYDGNNGSITVTNVNAVAPFTYSIDGLHFQSSATFNNLRAGIYTVTVVDANGCTGFITKTIAQPPQLTVVLNSVQSTCFGASTGAITVTAAGGTGGITYAWTGPDGYTSAQRNISSLATGTYTLTVTDNNGCSAQLTAVVASYNTITVTPVVTNIACKGEINGSIDLTVTGGTGSGFSYSWNTGAVSNNISGLGVGNYNVIITDLGSGCVENRSFTITQPATIVGISATKTNAAGCGTALGTITATGSGGTAPYQYKLNSGTYQPSNVFTGLYAGNYTVWVKDFNGCTRSAVVTITDNGTDQYESNNSKNQAAADTIGKIVNARIALSTDIADWFKFTTPAGSSNYTITLSHPSVTYTFNLYAAGNNTPALVPVSSATGTKTYTLAGNATYYISITGGLSYNCYQLVVSPTALPTTRTSSSPVEEVTYVKKPAEITVSQLQASVYPNPHTGIFNLLIKSPENGVANIELFSGSGQKVITRNVSVKAGDNIVTFNSIQQSLLLYKVTIGKNYVSGKVIGPK